MIEIIFLDVDGCMTEGKVIYNSCGDEIQEFNVKDGGAIKAWLKLGKKIAIITGRNSKCVELRAKALGIELVYQGIGDKLKCANEILKNLNLNLSQSAAIGDYFNDIKLLNAVKLSFKPKDGHNEIKAYKNLKSKGGKGAISEMIEYIIKYNKMQKEWDELWL